MYKFEDSSGCSVDRGPQDWRVQAGSPVWKNECDRGCDRTQDIFGK